MKDKITKSKIEKYYKISTKAFIIAKNAVVSGKEKEAKEIFLMVESYLKDSMHFLDKGDYVNSYGALNYTHGWIDCGARLKIYRVTDNKLFTV